MPGPHSTRTPPRRRANAFGAWLPLVAVGLVAFGVGRYLPRDPAPGSPVGDGPGTLPAPEESGTRAERSHAKVRALAERVHLPEDLPAGIWGRARAGEGPAATEEQARRMQELEALGYADGVELADGASGVTVHARGRAQAGANLYVSGHGPEAILMDMEGQRLHSWRVPPPFRQPFLGAAHPYPNGDLLVLLGISGMVKLDRNSEILWAKGNQAHHDLQVDEHGRIYTLVRKARVDPEVHPTEPILFDYVAVLDPQGEELARISIYQAFRASAFAPFLQHGPEYGDILHANTIEVLDGSLADRSSAFRAGNFLVSLKKMSTVAVLDPATRQVVWAMTGLWDWQHRPSIVPGGRMLVFDNLGGAPETGLSRVIEYDPFTQEVHWIYEGVPGNPLESTSNGTCMRLTNGNTLIVESHNGRALEVTHGKEIVWEFRSPHRTGPNDEFVAVLFDLVRLDEDFPLDWIE